MALFYEDAPCGVCCEPIGDRDSIGFDFFALPAGDAYAAFDDSHAHTDCLARWSERDHFVAAWNAGLARHGLPRRLVVGPSGRVAYVVRTWRDELPDWLRRRLVAWLRWRFRRTAVTPRGGG